MNLNKLDSLIALLDDPDDSVFHVVLDELLKEDVSVVEYLEHAWEISLDDLVQQRLEGIIREIQLKDTRKKIVSWADQESIDLLEAVFLLARQQFPEIKLKSVQVQLDKLRKEVWIEFRNSLTSIEKITILNHIFFDHYKFKVDHFNPESPNNSYINKILDTKRGNSVSIAILYMLVARSLSLPVYYIDYQQNPLLGYFDETIAPLVYGDDVKHSLLFYINPSNNGAIIGLKEVDYILHTSNNHDRAQLTEKCPEKMIVKRLIEKLIISYKELGHNEKVNYLSDIVAIL
jgi:hypothetical protein